LKRDGKIKESKNYSSEKFTFSPFNGYFYVSFKRRKFNTLITAVKKAGCCWG